ncbi:MAG: hypothetical protein HKN13_00825, partial [Rhodothermales bacterium]|nr:hypothetical protein [Rhodothermales bacterium]
MRKRTIVQAGVFGIAAIVAFVSPVSAEDGSANETRETERIVTASSLRSAIVFGATSATIGSDIASGGARSVPLAAGLSAVLPGVGQAYNRQWIKAGIGLAIEAALIIGYIQWRNEGLDAERAFKRQAHRDWDPGQYASWINDYTVFLEEVHGGSFSFAEIQVPASIDFTNPDAWTESDRAAVFGLFRDIRSAELELFHPETGASFSHRLPDFGDQQYYELIGKYFQFAPGWTDYPEWVSEDGYTDAIDPERTDPDGSKTSVSSTFFQYARDHAHSQDLLRRASIVTS